MNLPPVSVPRATMAKGNEARMSFSAFFTPTRALLGTGRNSLHPMHSSVTVQVKAKSPRFRPPSWPARSA